MRLRTAIAASAALLASLPSLAQQPPALQARLTGEWQVMYDPARHRCDGHDVPDTPPRVYRNSNGALVMFALHYIARPLRGPDLENLKPDCVPAYDSPFDSDPSRYNSQSWIAATWTQDGMDVHALVHHEYRAALHKRCSVPVNNALACWYNTMLAARSRDGGRRFRQHSYPVVAAAPVRQEFEQHRHRGFLNPSNMFSDGTHVYFFAAQTGWRGQPHGVCLFRSADPARERSWRAFDGSGFTILYDDPYRPGLKLPRPCKTIEPFPAQVGAVVRHRASGQWLAVVQSWRDGKRFPVPGFYLATSRDLIRWSEPALLIATRSHYDDASCVLTGVNTHPIAS